MRTVAVDTRTTRPYILHSFRIYKEVVGEIRSALLDIGFAHLISYLFSSWYSGDWELQLRVCLYSKRVSGFLVLFSSYKFLKLRLFCLIRIFFSLSPSIYLICLLWAREGS